MNHPSPVATATASEGEASGLRQLAPAAVGVSTPPPSTRLCECGSMLLDQVSQCFRCRWWADWSARASDPETIVADGRLFRLGPLTADAPRSHRGHGGARYVFRRLDGTVLESVDVWLGIEVPDHFRDRLPDNAVLVSDTKEAWG